MPRLLDFPDHFSFPPEDIPADNAALLQKEKYSFPDAPSDTAETVLLLIRNYLFPFSAASPFPVEVFFLITDLHVRFSDQKFLLMLERPDPEVPYAESSESPELDLPPAVLPLHLKNSLPKCHHQNLRILPSLKPLWLPGSSVPQNSFRNHNFPVYSLLPPVFHLSLPASLSALFSYIASQVSVLPDFQAYLSYK